MVLSSLEPVLMEFVNKDQLLTRLLYSRIVAKMFNIVKIIRVRYRLDAIEDDVNCWKFFFY